MRPHSVFIYALLISVFVIVTSNVAVADEALRYAKLNKDPRTEPLAVAANNSPKTLASKEVLNKLEEAEATPFAQRFHLTKKGRVIYLHQFQAGGQNISLKLSGPFVKSKPGLGIKVMGLAIGGLPMEIKGYGNSKKQGIQVKIRF
jgi:hypothetical protein